MKLFEELNRRKVLKTLGIYIVVAWGLLQFIQIVADIWSLPIWLPQLTFVLLALGVPVAAFLSWVFNIERGGIVSDDNRYLVGLWRGGARGKLTLLSGCALGLVFTFVMLAYLWPDEPPSEDVRRLMTMVNQRSTDPMTLNYGLYGLTAPAGSDFWEEGQHRVVTFNLLGEMPDPGDNALRLTVARDDLCTLRDDACFERILAELDGIPMLLAANAEFLGRYRALRETRQFTEVIRITFDAPFPEFGQLISANRLMLREAAYAFHHSDEVAAWDILADELTFHRRMLAGSNNLITKMIALALIMEDLRGYAALVRHSEQPPLPPPRLSDAERAMVSALQWEAIGVIDSYMGRDRAFIAGLTRSPTVMEILFRTLPFKRNRTTNQTVTNMLAGARLSLLPPEEFARTEPALRQPSPLEWWFNGAGWILMSGHPDFMTYAWRVMDVDALIVLTQVVHHLRTEEVSASALGPTLLSLPHELRNPYNGNAPTWRDGALHFDLPGPEYGRRPITLPYTP